MSQKVELQQRQPRDAADAQHVSGPHFDPYRASADSSLDQSQCVSTRSLQCDLAQTDARENDTDNVLITVLMPCLNEARTLAACIQQAHAGCQAALAARNINRSALASGSNSDSQPTDLGESTSAAAPEYTYEILIADNGSTDASPAIAIDNGARVIQVERKGYGAALRGGIAVAQGKYVVMGDSDCSYDFGEVPRFLDKLEEGYDLVMGNRFAGGIQPGAMPWHHRYIGNPILSGLGSLLYRTPIRDWHCGLRAFVHDRIRSVDLKSSGMEFASEVVIRACQNRFRIAEVPITLSPDDRDRPPHIRSIRDGARHLKLLLTSLRSSPVSSTLP